MLSVTIHNTQTFGKVIKRCFKASRSSMSAVTGWRMRLYSEEAYSEFADVYNFLLVGNELDSIQKCAICWTRKHQRQVISETTCHHQRLHLFAAVVSDLTCAVVMQVIFIFIVLILCTVLYYYVYFNVLYCWIVIFCCINALLH